MFCAWTDRMSRFRTVSAYVPTLETELPVKPGGGDAGDRRQTRRSGIAYDTYPESVH
jgi:hypothetical protein